MKQVYSQISVPPKPFVKWAGGKRQLIPVLEESLPRSFGTYFEPFLGGGALLFHILAKDPGRRCDVSDLNSDLVSAYLTVRDRVGDLVASLRNHERNYQRAAKSYYYSVREGRPRSAVERTSRLLFLNRTCFNGLYRVNSKGRFNVPLGRYANPSIVNEENLRSVSAMLGSGKISIHCRDFGGVLARAKAGDLVYFDPPYQPVSETASFTGYTDRDFAYDDLVRLADLCRRLDSKGCKVMLSNSDSGEVAALFPGRRWKASRIRANRSINSNSKRRTGHHELLIRNY